MANWLTNTQVLLNAYIKATRSTCKTCGNTHFLLCTKHCKICRTEINKSTTRGIMRIVYSKFIIGSNKCHENGHGNDWNAHTLL